jgi:NADPH:quinone reductase-like Zn-dependent oxidoreductase
VNYETTKFEDAAPPVDAVLDTVGGETQLRSFRVLKPGGILVSVISPPPRTAGFRATFFIADVTATRLDILARLVDSR